MSRFTDAIMGSTEREVVLHWQRFFASDVIPDCVRAARLEARESIVVRGLALTLTAHVLGQKLPAHTETATRIVTVGYPASWWQHVKHQHGHRWWLRALARRRPARMTEVRQTVTFIATWEHMQAYPWSQYTYPVPDYLGNPVRLRWMSYDTRVSEPYTQAGPG